MPQTAITIVGSVQNAIDRAAENRFGTLIREIAAESFELKTLKNSVAVDFILPACSEKLLQMLREKLVNQGPFDIFVQPDDEFRKKKMLLADMDATMVEGETLDELAAHAGIKDKIAPITAAAMRGEIDFQEALHQRIGLLKGLPVSALAVTLAGVKPSKGAETLVKTMGRFGAHCILISGGFDFVTTPIGKRLGFHRDVGNRLGIHNDALTGEVMVPIVDKDTKKNTLIDEARARQIDLRATAAVGDGANDIPMLQAAGAGIGYFGKPAVQAATPYQIRYTDLTSILFMQGYREDEFAKA